jgi:hypothetical protein
MAAQIDSPRSARRRAPPGVRERIVRPHHDFKAGSGQEGKKGHGGRHNLLKRLNSAKETQAFPLIFFGRTWPDSAGIWENLGSALKNQVSTPPSRNLGLSPCKGLQNAPQDKPLAHGL